MVAPRHLPKAPITEALVDIRVKLAADTELAKLGSIHELIVDQYPKRKERRRREFSFEFKEGEPPRQTATDIADGYFYISSDDKQVVQARLDGFTFSRLKPYEKWESMRDEARRLWQLYVKFASPEFITRIAVRSPHI